jgi:hypothetical protein
LLLLLLLLLMMRMYQIVVPDVFFSFL